MNWILAQSSSGGFWMPTRASTVADNVDGVFNFVLWITVFFTTLVMALMFAFVIKYRFRPGRERADREAPAHHTALELTWTVIPTIIVLVVFYFGFRGYLNMSVAPPYAYEIMVNAKTWNWEFTYPNGHVDTELHVPINAPVRLVLSSQDVLHSFFVPQFRVKRDAVPGRYNRLWFEANQLSPPEGFDVYCTEYCGTGHSQMLTKAFVHDMAGYTEWLRVASDWEKRGLTPVQAGQMFVEKRGCVQCHSLDGTAKTAPTFKDLFGRQEPLADGSTVIADENYIRESLYEPAAKVVRGYTVQMQSYKGSLQEKDVAAIIAYLKTLSQHGQSVLPGQAGATTGAAAPATAPTNAAQ